MRKLIGMIALCVASGMFLLLAAACGTQPDGGGTANSAPVVKTEPAMPPSDKGDKVVTGGDLAFMNDAAPGNMAEVEMGKLAVKQGASKDVKQFGQKMIDDHTKAGQELMRVAEQKKVMLPPDVLPVHKESMAKLSKLTGADFDREYVKAMVEDHEKDVAAFDNAAKTGADADVKAFAMKTLPTLQMHLQMIRDIQGKMGGGKAKP